MPAIPAKLAEFVEMVELLPDRADRIELLIDTAGRFKTVAPEIAEPPYAAQNRVPGCESKAYVWALDREDGTVDFHFAVENPQGISAQAMAVLLGDSCSGAPLDQVAALEDEFVYAVFGNELSMGKSMGLMGMVGMVRAEAKKRVSAS